jgi:hypothetical protein
MPKNPTPDRTMRQAFFFSWLIISLAGLLTLILPFAVDKARIDQVLPACRWQELYQKPCPFCGMTAGFYHLCQGEAKKAFKANSFSPWLFGIFVLNSLTCLMVLGFKLSAINKKHLHEKGT